MRYQTAPRPGTAESRRRAADGNRTRTKSLEGSCATVTPRPREPLRIEARRSLSSLGCVVSAADSAAMRHRGSTSALVPFGFALLVLALGAVLLIFNRGG